METQRFDINFYKTNFTEGWGITGQMHTTWTKSNFSWASYFSKYTHHHRHLEFTQTQLTWTIIRFPYLRSISQALPTSTICWQENKNSEFTLEEKYLEQEKGQNSSRIYHLITLIIHGNTYTRSAQLHKHGVEHRHQRIIPHNPSITTTEPLHQPQAKKEGESLTIRVSTLHEWKHTILKVIKNRKKTQHLLLSYLATYRSHMKWK